MIDSSNGREIPVNWIIKDEITDDPNGTCISILNLNIERVRRASIIDYIERHLQAFRAKSPDVAIDDHICVYREPATSETDTFEPTASKCGGLGDVQRTLKASWVPLT